MAKRKAQTTIDFKVVKRAKTTKKKSKTKASFTRKRMPTTLSRDLAIQPFPKVMKTVMVYENELTAGGASVFATYSIACNSMFDFDKSGTTFGNKQPLYYDQVLGAAGPYRRYKVTSWRTRFTVINASASTPITVWTIPPITAINEDDIAAEADNMPGVKRLYLGPLSSAKNQGTLSVVGNIWDCASLYADSDNNMQGAYNSDPTTIIYGGLNIRAADGTTAPTVWIAVKHEFDVELSEFDAVVS